LAQDGRLLHFSVGGGKKNVPHEVDLWERWHYHKRRPLQQPLLLHDPENRLDLPNLWDNFYTHLLDWSCNNTIAIALKKTVYLIDVQNGSHRPLLDLDVLCTVVSFSPGGKWLAIVGTSAKNKKPRIDLFCSQESASPPLSIPTVPSSKVGTVCWNSDNEVTFGTYHGHIYTLDLRTSSAVLSALRRDTHKAEICTLKWSSDQRTLASGGDDNCVKIWDKRNMQKPTMVLDDFKGSVRALDWHPHRQNWLLTGAGSNDGRIRLFNTSASSKPLRHEIAATKQAQVTAVAWMKDGLRWASSYGFLRNEVCLWHGADANVPKITYRGHSSGKRVADIAFSPSGDDLVSIGTDESMCFWKTNVSHGDKSKPARSASFAELPNGNIR
jgi:WD40 repeat protein